MKQLIVNADDLGADEARNAGIFEAIAAGSVTSVSILANGPALEDAIRGIRQLEPERISLGLHFNLSEGLPIASGLNLLTGRDGRFLGKASAQRLLTRRENKDLENEIRKELSAQIAVLKKSGVAIDHLDGHQHVHVLPAVFGVSADEAKSHEIPWVRIPEEDFEGSRIGLSPTEWAWEGSFFSGHAQAARPFYDAAGIRTTDQFRGLYLKGQLDASHWKEFLEQIPPGLTEFMVHPGHAGRRFATGPFAGFSTADRDKELRALTDPRFHKAIREAGVHLTPFPAAK